MSHKPAAPVTDNDLEEGYDAKLHAWLQEVDTRGLAHFTMLRRLIDRVAGASGGSGEYLGPHCVLAAEGKSIAVNVDDYTGFAMVGKLLYKMNKASFTLTSTTGYAYAVFPMKYPYDPFYAVLDSFVCEKDDCFYYPIAYIVTEGFGIKSITQLQYGMINLSSRMF